MSLSSVACRVSPLARHTLHPFVALAFEAVQAFVRDRRIIAPPPDLFERYPLAADRAGAFVCLKAYEQLRGCIGTTEPTQENLAAEIIANAIAAASRDPRFTPVRPEELDDLQITVDVLSPPEPVTDESQLDHRRYGLIVRAGLRRGVLLPDIEPINSVQEQIAIARLKAGIGPNEPADLFRFEVTRFR